VIALFVECLIVGVAADFTRRDSLRACLCKHCRRDLDAADAALLDWRVRNAENEAAIGGVS